MQTNWSGKRGPVFSTELNSPGEFRGLLASWGVERKQESSGKLLGYHR